MRVLQVINSLGTGGAEKLLLDSIPLYNARGITMDLLLLNGEEHPFLKQLQEKNCCTIYTLGKGSIYNPLVIFKLFRYLKKYDIIHVHLFPALYWVALAKGISFSRVKLIYTEHSTNNRRMQNFFFRIIDNFIYRHYKKIVCISDEVDVVLKKHLSIDFRFFELINNGVDVSKIFNETKYSKQELGLNFSENDILLLQVSSFQHPKDQATLIKAMQHLPSEVKLLLVGEGELKEKNEKLSEELGLTNRVYFLGLRLDVSKLLKTVDIVILSSQFEGLSLSSIEGLASGRPFLASEAPGLINVVNNAGVMFSIGNDVALADEIKKLIADKDYYDSTVKRCLSRAKEFDINIMIEKYIALYESL